MSSGAAQAPAHSNQGFEAKQSPACDLASRVVFQPEAAQIPCQRDSQLVSLLQQQLRLSFRSHALRHMAVGLQRQAVHKALFPTNDTVPISDALSASHLGSRWIPIPLLRFHMGYGVPKYPKPVMPFMSVSTLLPHNPIAPVRGVPTLSGFLAWYAG